MLFTCGLVLLVASLPRPTLAVPTRTKGIIPPKIKPTPSPRSSSTPPPPWTPELAADDGPPGGENFYRAVATILAPREELTETETPRVAATITVTVTVTSTLDCGSTSVPVDTP